MTPELIGTLPQWLLFASVILAFFKLIPSLRAQTIEGKQADADTWREECSKVRLELRECEQDCDRRLRKLEEELWAEKRQRVAEQISLINIILSSIDAPALKTLLKTLESIQVHLVSRQMIENDSDEPQDTL